MWLDYKQDIAAQLDEFIHKLAHILPSQAPIADFVHHNTLHGFQHLNFPDALKELDDLTGVVAYMAPEDFIESYQQGRVTDEDITAVIANDVEDEIWLTDPDIRLADIYKAVLTHGIRPVSSSHLQWQIEERGVLTKETSKLWHACLEVLSLEQQFLHPENLTDLTPEFAKKILNAAGIIEEEQADYLLMHKKMRKDSDNIRIAMMGKVGTEITLRGLLKTLTGHDILDDIRPGLLRHMASFLDFGVAAWHNKQHKNGFFASWRASALTDLIRLDNEMPDWQDEISSLPEDPLEAIIYELYHLGLKRDKWLSYLEKIALELPGWSGMFLWRHLKDDKTDPKINIIDYFAVRLVLERIYAQRLTRRKWQIEATLPTISWYFHRRRSELYVRYQLYAGGELSEYLNARANHLTLMDANLHENYARWQHLADMIFTWQQSNTLKQNYNLHQHAWPLFKLMQVLGVDARQVATLNHQQIETVFAALARLDKHKSGYLCLQAYELNYQQQFFSALANNVGRGNWLARKSRPTAQIFFCMDDREEGIRRHLEDINPKIETFGAAAFFDLPIIWQDIDKNRLTLSPVSIRPVHEIHETVHHDAAAQLSDHQTRLAWRLRIEDWLNQEQRRNLIGSMLLTFLAAPLALLTMLAKIFAPLVSGEFIRFLRGKIDRHLKTDVSFTTTKCRADASFDDPNMGFSDEEQAQRIAGFLRNNGLIDNFSPLVVIMGHGSTNENNPHRSAYGCGACSGKYSGPNGRIFARMANRVEVRALMAQEGFNIPRDTWFVGANHNTCNEEITWYDVDLVPDAVAFKRIQEQLKEACHLSAHERARKFASAPKNPSINRAFAHIVGRSYDFSQSRPELGHATNAAALVGRRSVTQGAFFDRRLFLISYDSHADDENGTILESTLLSVGPVGAGINLEYYFSRVRNDILGSGSKVTHNVAGFFGVMHGVESDLKTGLPGQMIEIHEPMRLQVTVEAKTAILTKIYQRQSALRELIGNRWILLSAIDPDNGQISIFDPDQGFSLWQDKKPLPTVKKSADYYGGHMQPLKPVLLDKAS